MGDLDIEVGRSVSPTASLFKKLDEQEEAKEYQNKLIFYMPIQRK